MGNRDLREMEAGRMDTSGQGLTQAGRVLGIIVTLFFLVVLVLATIVAVIAIAANA